ncbi:MAG: hypothetical protein R3224_02870 [Balneolaceae bacterium]|nr:hypothetical protein [Balneolaceae bacterium]
MNVGIVTSFAVGGLLLLSILSLNRQVMVNSSGSAIKLMSKQNVDNVVDYVAGDFRHIGYNSEVPTPITIFEDDRFQFRGGMESAVDNNTYRVTYHAKPTVQVMATSNPNDYVLERKVELYSGGTFSLEHKTKFPVTHFKIEYINGQGNQATLAGQIKEVRVEIVWETAEPIRYEGEDKENPVYDRTIWKQNIFPENLQDLN